MSIEHMGKFTATGMRTSLPAGALVINTCGQNDTAERGTDASWVWCNPTNRAITHQYADVEAVSVECLWQGTKITVKNGWPREKILGGQWRAGKGKRPLGAWAGEGQPLITTPGEARRKIYVPAYRRLVEHWLQSDETVRLWVNRAWNFAGDVYLRDFDTGRGIDRAGPMSHAWVLATFLNTGVWPDGVGTMWYLHHVLLKRGGTK